MHHCWPIIICHRQDCPKVLEGGDRGKGSPVGGERNFCHLIHLFLRQLAPPLLSPAENFCRGILYVYIPLQDKHVEFGASGVGSVSLLQDHNCVLQVAIHKVSPEVGPVFCPPPGNPLPGTGVVTDFFMSIICSIIMNNDRLTESEYNKSKYLFRISKK